MMRGGIFGFVGLLLVAACAETASPAGAPDSSEPPASDEGTPPANEFGVPDPTATDPSCATDTYAATKAFVLSFSESMHLELKPKVRVLAVCPGYTKTEFHDAAGGLANHLMRFPAMDPVRVARTALRAVARGRAVVIPGAMNKVQVLLSKIFPGPFVRWTASKLFEPRG